MYYIKANGLISSEFSYLFPHTFHQSACHPLHINTRKEKKVSESEKALGRKETLQVSQTYTQTSEIKCLKLRSALDISKDFNC